jgi:hypothetical protein
LRALFLPLRASGIVKGNKGGVEFNDIKSLKGLKEVKELYKVLIRFLIASGFKERSNESLEIANI